MATVALGVTYSPPSPLEMHYADTVSHAYPDRPIRPLPKRRLRSRLPSEVADSILYPTGVGSSRPLFQVPYDAPTNLPNGVAQSGGLTQRQPSSAEKGPGGEARKDSYRFRGNDLGSDDERELVSPRQRQRPGPGANASSRTSYLFSRNEASKFIKPPIPQSTASSGDSVDGYDSFENTNNKKKRKIPTSGSLGGHQSSLSADMAQMGISSSRELDGGQLEVDGGVGHYYGTGSSAVPAVSSGNGISGAGRGRYGRGGTRHHSGRSPLGVSVNGSNTLQRDGPIYRRNYPTTGNVGLKEAASGPLPDQGIISAAIANAAALPSTPVRGQENMSLLEQPSKKSGSAKTQFTFTCESDSAKSMVWPDTQSPTPNTSLYDEAARGPRLRNSQNNRDFATQGTQTSPNMASQPGQPASQQPIANSQAPQQPKKPRRPLVKQYAIAARERRLRQEYTNYHHPPKDEDVWICEFCEYESIFGEPPRALIQQYEAKDRQERKRLAEKRRLLEKAKMKGRKGKKGNKNAAKHSAAVQSQQPTQKQRYDQQPVDSVPMQNQGTQSDEYVPDDYDEDPAPVQNVPIQAPSKIPQPVPQNRNKGPHAPSGSGATG